MTEYFTVHNYKIFTFTILAVMGNREFFVYSENFQIYGTKLVHCQLILRSACS